MTHMVPMNHPNLPDQPIEVLPEQVPAFEDSGWATGGDTADDPTPVPPVADPTEPHEPDDPAVTGEPVPDTTELPGQDTDEDDSDAEGGER